MAATHLSGSFRLRHPLLPLAGHSYPFIEIADGLGGGGKERAGDWMCLCFTCVIAVIVIVIGHFVAWIPVRLVLTLGLLAYIVTRIFQSPDTPYAARLALESLVGVLLAADGLPALATRKPGWLFLGRCGWVMAVPGIVLMADWQGRVWLGQVPSSYRPVATRMTAARLPQPVSRPVMQLGRPFPRLLGCGQEGENGTLLVESLDGGPAFQATPDPRSGVQSGLPSILAERTDLAVCDNHRMYQDQSRITICRIVVPGNAMSPPIVHLRQELPTGEHDFFDARFFPDGQTLLVCNSNKDGPALGRGIGTPDCVVCPQIGESWNWPAQCVAVSPDGQTFATWAIHGIGVSDRLSLRLIRAMDTHQNLPVALSYSPDSSELIAVAEGIWRWKLAPAPCPFSCWWLHLAALSFGSPIRTSRFIRGNSRHPR